MRHNIGSFIVIPIIIFHIICIFIFYNNELDKIKDKINAIILGVKNMKINKKSKKGEQSKEKLHNEKNKSNFYFHIKKNKKAKKKIGAKLELKKKNTFLKNKSNKKNINIKFNILNVYNILTQNKKNISINKEKIIRKAEGIMKYNEQELNELNYELALKYDLRNYCEYYFSLIRTKHDLVFAFCYNNDYNSKIIKIDLFFINFVMNFTINALFFNDDTMHKIYEEKGKFEILYQLPQIIYSTIISQIFNSLLQLLALSDDLILIFKHKKILINTIKSKIKLFNRLNIKFILYFIISTIFLLLFWYYLSMFCVIYSNTQLHLVKDTLISFAMSLLYPFGIYLLPGIFRIPSLSIRNKSSKKNKIRKLLYTFSKLLQFF